MAGGLRKIPCKSNSSVESTVRLDSLADKQVGWDCGWLVDSLSRE